MFKLDYLLVDECYVCVLPTCETESYWVDDFDMCERHKNGSVMCINCGYEFCSKNNNVAHTEIDGFYLDENVENVFHISFDEIPF